MTGAAAAEGGGCACGEFMGWRLWGLREPLAKDKDLTGWVCGGVSVSVSGVWVRDVLVVVGFKSMAQTGTKSWDFEFGRLGFP